MHIDIQEQFKIKGGDEKDSMGDLAMDIIDRSYKDFKIIPENTPRLLGLEVVTTLLHLTYVAKDAYVSYEMYQRIMIINDRLHHCPYLNDEVRL